MSQSNADKENGLVRAELLVVTRLQGDIAVRDFARRVIERVAAVPLSDMGSLVKLEIVLLVLAELKATADAEGGV